MSHFGKSICCLFPAIKCRAYESIGAVGMWVFMRVTQAGKTGGKRVGKRWENVVSFPPLIHALSMRFFCRSA